MDVNFLRDIAVGNIVDLGFSGPVIEASFSAVVHLAHTLRMLYLSDTELTDMALASIAELGELTLLQSWGNRFTDEGVHRLKALSKLEHLYLEEATLSVHALDVVASLPNLAVLGIQDMAVTDAELAGLRLKFPNLRISR